MERTLIISNGEKASVDLSTLKTATVKITSIIADKDQELTNTFSIVSRAENGSVRSIPFTPASFLNPYSTNMRTVTPNLVIYDCDITTIEVEPKASPTAKYYIEFIPLTRYFAQFSFQSTLTGIEYWFPLFLNARNQTEAEKLVDAVLIALQEQYTKVRYQPPILETVNSNKSIRLAINQKSTYQKNKLDFRVWNFKGIDVIPNVGFNENLEIAFDNLQYTADTIAEVTTSIRLPVSILRDNKDIDFKEYLMLDVVG